MARWSGTASWWIAIVVVSAASAASVAGCRRGRVEAGTSTATARNGVERAALERATSEIPCPSTALRLTAMGASSYRVTGCGSFVTYTCTADGWGRVACILNERGSTGAAGPPRAARESVASTWSDEQITAFLAEIRDAAYACLPSGTASLEVALIFRSSGAVAQARRHEQAPAIAACLDQVLLQRRMPGTVGASRTVRTRIAPPGSAPAMPAPDTAPATPAPMGEPPATVEEAVRAAIDGRSGAIMACVSAPHLALQVTWGPEGTLDATIEGAAASSPEERCVRAVVQRARIPAPRSAGVLLHVVERPAR